MSVAMMTDEQVNRSEHVFSEPGFGAMCTERGNLPLEALDVRADISGLFARTTLKQTFRNNLEQPLEATYIFPLPDRGAVVGFKMYVAERVVEGVIKERGAARRDYDQAIAQGQRASIVEEDRPDTFTMRVGNIAPGERATIELELIVPLVFSAGEATFRFPLVVAPRYIPGNPLEGQFVGDGTSPDTAAVPDASRITPPVLLPGFKSPVRLGIEVALDHTGLAAELGLTSSLHAVTASSNAHKTVVRIQPGERVNRDFILRFRVAQDKVRTTYTLIPDADGEASTFLLTLVPPARSADVRRPRQIVFVLDRSGSMEGWKMVAARRAVGRMIDTLGADDSFQVLAFDTVVEKPANMGEGLIQATNRNRFRVLEWLPQCDARGGTEMAEPLYDALSLLEAGAADYERYVVLVTDGQVGNEDQIVKGVHQRMKGAHVFTVGIDQAVNAGFLTRLAEISGGRCELVESEDRLDAVMEKLHRMIDTPVVNDVRLAFDGGNLVPGSLVPDRAATLFAAAPLTVAGRLVGGREGRVRVMGQTPGGVLYEETLAPTVVPEPALAAVWARQKIRALEDEYATGQTSRAALTEKIVETSLKFKVLCRFTSFVAVDTVGHVTGDLAHVVQPVETPEGWGGLGGMPMASTGMAPQIGAMMQKSARRSSPAPAAAPAPAPRPVPMAAAQSPVFDRLSEAPFEAKSYEQESFADEAPPSPEFFRVERSRSKKTRAGVLGGLRVAMSPEKIRGLHLSAAHDVFVMALLWVELLTGKKLFAGASEFEMIQAIQGWDVANLPSYLERWKSVLSVALAADPRDRYSDAAAFADAVVELADELGIKPANVQAGVSTQTLKSFGSYELTARLARGNGFEIWAGTRGTQPRVVRIWDASISGDSDAVDRLHEEVRVLAPHVLSLAEFGVEEGDAYLAYEGQAVAGLASPMDEASAFKAILSMASAIHVLHASDAILDEFSLADMVVLADGTFALVGLGPSSREVAHSPGLLGSIQNWLKVKSREFWK